MKSVLTLAIVTTLLTAFVPAASALEVMSAHPYRGAIVVDAANGAVLFQDKPDIRSYPASVVKLMVLLILLEAVDADSLQLDDSVTVTRGAAKMGGSQVYLAEGEIFPVEELLYAMVVKSANDAAVALAIHFVGSKEAFVELMNERARTVGMYDTVFHSVHGLPPGRGQSPDVSTPRDIAKLCRVLLQRSDVLQYTSTKRRLFRTQVDEPFILDNTNPLLKRMPGCDGLKTGFFYAAGFSIAATATDGDQRVVAVVMGAESQRTRDNTAKKMLADGLSDLVTDQ